MQSTPENQQPQFLPQSEIDAKFHELCMLTYLNDKTLFKRVKIKENPLAVSIRVFGRKYRRTDWRKENYIRLADNESQAIVEYRRTRIRDDEMRVVQFTDQEGNFYMRY